MQIRTRMFATAALIAVSLSTPALAAVSANAAAQPMGGEGAMAIDTVPVREPVVTEEVIKPEHTPILDPSAKGVAEAVSAEPKVLAPATSPYNAAAVDEISKVNASAEVLQEITGIPEGISTTLLGNAYGIVIIPGTIKLGFFFGGQYGSGIAMVRNDDGSWSNPAFVYLGGGSFGLQFGAVSSDIILVFKTRKSIMGLTNGSFTLGGDAAVAAGPVGRRAVALTDWQLKAEIYSYARSRGFFAGISLDGSVLAIDTAANANFYSRPGVSADQIFASDPSSAPAVIRLKDFLTKNAAPLGE